MTAMALGLSSTLQQAREATRATKNGMRFKDLRICAIPSSWERSDSSSFNDDHDGIQSSTHTYIYIYIYIEMQTHTHTHISI